MDPNQLFSSPIDNEFREWLSRFASLDELFSSRSQLYSKLSEQQIDGVVEERVTILGPVHISQNSHVRSGAVLNGPLVVGPNSVVDHGAKLLSGTFVGSGTHIRSGAFVFDSIIMNGCTVSENCIVQSSVLGCGVVAKAGCLLGDAASAEGSQATFIGDGVQLGLGAIICPGSIIAQRESILAGSVIVAR